MLQIKYFYMPLDTKKLFLLKFFLTSTWFYDFIWNIVYNTIKYTFLHKPLHIKKQNFQFREKQVTALIASSLSNILTGFFHNALHKQPVKFSIS